MATRPRPEQDTSGRSENAVRRVCVTGKELKKKDRVLSEAAKPSLAAGIFDG